MNNLAITACRDIRKLKNSQQPADVEMVTQHFKKQQEHSHHVGRMGESYVIPTW